MGDPREGIAADGVIVTGVARSRVPETFEPVLADVVAARPERAGVYLYGSVATGTARVPDSDVDLIAVDWPAQDARATARRLSERYAKLCRGVELAPARSEDFQGEADPEYGNRVFLRHYCVRLGGPVVDVGGPFRADARAARGFNGDLPRHTRRWRQRLEQGDESLGPAMARKVMLAVAGLVSIHDGTWTTDRAVAARRWAQLEPADAAEIAGLLQWSVPGQPVPHQQDVAAALDGVVARIMDRFADRIGMWPD